MAGKLFKVKALYDFVASHPDDLAFSQNDVLTITNSDYGDGWFYGRNNIGREGMIPSSYVEALPPSMPPPPLPGNSGSSSQYYNSGGDMLTDLTYENQADQISYQNTPPMPPSFNNVQTSYGNSSGGAGLGATDIAYANQLPPSLNNSKFDSLGAMGGTGNSYMNSVGGAAEATGSSAAAASVPQFDDEGVTVYDDWDEEWDSDDDVSTTAGSQVFPHNSASATNGNTSTSASNKASAPKSKGLELNQRAASTSNDDLPTPPEKSGGKGGGGGGSWFSGGSKALDYLMGSLKLNSEVSEEVTIFQTTAGPYWEAYPPGHMIKCLLSDPTKQSKLKGMKKFLAYQLTSTIPSASGVPLRSSSSSGGGGAIVVQRRYKHFDWLYDRLRERYPIVCIPPLPDKQVTGRYEADFIHKRMCRLQHWMNRMSRHPVIGRSQVYRHFISETDATRWKDGKRKAEKDDYKDSAFFLTLKTPNAPLDLSEMGAKIDRFTNFALALREKLKVLNARSREVSKCHHTVYKTTFSKFGTALKEISDTLSVDARPSNVALASAMEFAGETYEEVGKLYDAQPWLDAGPLCEALVEYAGIISHLPELRALHQCSLHKVRQLQDQEELGRVETEQVQQVQDRTKVVTFSVLAEMNNFQSDRDVDFSDMMRDYLQQQLIFYNNISQRIRLALERFEPRNLQQQQSTAASVSSGTSSTSR